MVVWVTGASFLYPLFLNHPRKTRGIAARNSNQPTMTSEKAGPYRALSAIPVSSLNLLLAVAQVMTTMRNEMKARRLVNI